MIGITSALLAMAIGIAVNGPLDRLFGPLWGNLLNLLLTIYVYYATRKFLRNLRDD